MYWKVSTPIKIKKQNSRAVNNKFKINVIVGHSITLTKLHIYIQSQVTVTILRLPHTKWHILIDY